MPRIYASSLLEGAGCSSIRVLFSSDYKPDNRTTQPLPIQVILKPPTLDPGGNLPAYLIECGWIPYVNTLHADPSALIQLVALPSPRMVDTWPEHSEGYRIEEGLLILCDTLRLYLLTADTRVNSCHDSVCDALVAE
jgi:hypothetical protein